MSDIGSQNVPVVSGLRITGGASARDVAAIITVLSAQNAPVAESRPSRRWGSPAWLLSHAPSPTPGPGAWRASTLPH